LDAKGLDIVQKIGEGLQRMGDLVEGILTHAQVGTTAIGSSETTDAGAAFEFALQDLRKDIETSRAEIHGSPLPDLYIKEQALARLFQNLVSNAIKYRRPNAAPVISITAERDGDRWVLAVKDNGIGIEPQYLERIFLPMQRLHGSDIPGSGIGLATCHKIVTRAGGRIWVESVPGEGSTFFFTLPGPGPTRPLDPSGSE